MNSEYGFKSLDCIKTNAFEIIIPKRKFRDIQNKGKHEKYRSYKNKFVQIEKISLEYF